VTANKKRFTAVLNDGRRLRATSLGRNRSTDTGLLKIESKAEFPHLQMGQSSTLVRGQWCVMLGFAGKRRPGLTPPLRLGRVLRVVDPGRGYLVTDCTMSAGDSGGPLFDMHGRVIGINSRISRDLADNMHVPIDAFRHQWDQLVAGAVTGRRGTQPPPTPGWLGAVGDRQAEAARIVAVRAGSPAAQAGIEVGDVIQRLNRRKIRSAGTLARQERLLWPGDTVKITLTRAGETMVLKATVAEMPEPEVGK
jgi:serine protease Do